jgi:hypothetical protein
MSPIVGSGEHGHHYTIGLTEQGLPEIFLSGRLENQVAYAIMEKLIKVWKNRGNVKVGLYNGFINLANQYKADAFVYYVDPTSVIEKSPTFLDLMRVVLPNAHMNMVQILWPDTKGRLPNNPAYEKHIDFHQMQLPEKSDGSTKEELLPPVLEVLNIPMDHSELIEWFSAHAESVLAPYGFFEALRRAGQTPESEFTAFLDVKDNILTIDFDLDGKENGKATFEIERETKQVVKMLTFKAPKTTE